MKPDPLPIPSRRPATIAAFLRFLEYAGGVVCPTLVFLVAGLLSVRIDTAIWPQWLGPNRDGQVRRPVCPDKLGTNQMRQVWRMELGPSCSRPAVEADRVFTTLTRDKNQEVVTAVDRCTRRAL